MKEFNNDNLKELRTDIDDILLVIGKEHNVDIKLGNCSYDATNATFQLKLSIQGSDKPEQEMLKKVIDYYKLDATKIASSNGKEYKLWGYNHKGKKYKFITERVLDGKKHKCTADWARQNFGI